MMINFSRNSNKLEFEYISTTKNMHFGEKNQMIKKVPGTSLLVLKTTAATTTATAEPTTAPETTMQTTEAVADEGGCGGAVLSTVSITAIIGTTLATFAFRKKKED